ncbi:hypothetical protein SBRCBS47491_009294 [Sporothrix bragantina]|uniref:Uncharacterized protein n=1 Tax=Sporothrix bragantina TaxID=671064 RepID=A0ABP0CVW7_9PEZI
MDTKKLKLGDDFFDEVEQTQSFDGKVGWYMCVVVNLAAVNYPELLPEVWSHIDSYLFPELAHDERFKVAQKLREALIKACGIMGAAKYILAKKDWHRDAGVMQMHPKRSARPGGAKEQASERGHAFWRRIYARNPEFDPNATIDASPDYAFVVRGQHIP